MPTTLLEMVAPGSLERLDRCGQSWKSRCIVHTVQVLHTLYFAHLVLGTWLILYAHKQVLNDNLSLHSWNVKQ